MFCSSSGCTIHVLPSTSVCILIHSFIFTLVAFSYRPVPLLIWYLLKCSEARSTPTHPPHTTFWDLTAPRWVYYEVTWLPFLNKWYKNTEDGLKLLLPFQQRCNQETVLNFGVIYSVQGKDEWERRGKQEKTQCLV